MRRAVFFDLDGTLTDPKAGITRSIQYALERLDQPVPDQEALTWCIGPPLLASFEKILGDKKQAETALRYYRERFSDVGLFENDLYDGISDALETIGGTGAKLFVATSKPHVYAGRIIEHFGLSKYFDHIFGSELDGVRSDKTELLAYALSETGVDAAAAAMVGDRSHDMIGARNNGLRAIGVLYGYGDEAELRGAGAHDIVAQVSDLPAIIRT